MFYYYLHIILFAHICISINTIYLYINLTTLLIAVNVVLISQAFVFFGLLD